MMKYFELFEEMMHGRWHIGELLLPDGTEPLLHSGILLNHSGPLIGEVHHVGRVLDFCLTTFAAPIATSALAEAVQSVAGADVQCIPVTISGQTGMYVLNCLRVIRCLDESKSEFLKWTEQDHRADLAGQYRQVTKLVLERSPIPIGAHFFRIKDWDVALIVSETVKNAMERVGCYGAKFTELEMA